ncbi:MAG: DegT/DnrJ/EryC1/StrS family aminotransferase [Armatimonadetes bacterium]|nr:DegT/DnrJ/EryC1/StrS family aminotransferase [Armatimonadota bacterium]
MSGGLLPGWPQYDQDQIDAVTRVLQSGKVNYWTGDESRLFESEFAARCGCAFGIALSNGTVALQLALMALDLEPGSEVIVTPRSFVASAAVVLMAGCRAVFADVDRDTGNFDPSAVEAAVTSRTRAIIAVHLAGWPCDMGRLMDIADRHGLQIIEDCAQAHGADVDGRPVGSFGRVATWSFCQDKIISTCGEGGMITTNDRGVWERCWQYKDHGKNIRLAEGKPVSQPHFQYVHDTLGSNCRMTEVQAAVGRVQLRRLDEWVARRRHNARILREELGDVSGLRAPIPTAGVHPSYYKYYAYTGPGVDRDRVAARMMERGIRCSAGSCSEIYLEKPFRDAGMAPAAPLPVAHELGETSLMLQVHPTLNDGHMCSIAQALREAVAEARG